MSLKPPKHSEQKWPKRRGGRKRSLHLDYNLIVCEGSKTEPNYFLSLKDHINQKNLIEYSWKSWAVSAIPSGFLNVHAR